MSMKTTLVWMFAVFTLSLVVVSATATQAEARNYGPCYDCARTLYDDERSYHGYVYYNPYNDYNVYAYFDSDRFYQTALYTRTTGRTAYDFEYYR